MHSQPPTIIANRKRIIHNKAVARQRLPQQLPATSENPCTGHATIVRVVVGSPQQLPQQLPAVSENPCSKRTIMARVVVAVRRIKINLIF